MAAEVLSIIGAVGGLGKTLVDISIAINDFAGISQEVSSVREEVEALARVNEALRNALLSNPARPTKEWLEMTERVVSGCQHTTGEICVSISRSQTKNTNKVTFWKKVTWTVQRGEVEKYTRQLRSYSEMLGRLQIGLIHQSGQRVETMLVEALERLAEIQGTPSGVAASLSLDQRPAHRTGSGITAAPSSAAIPRTQIALAAKEAVSGTAIGTTLPPPPYDPSETDLAKFGKLIKSWHLSRCYTPTNRPVGGGLKKYHNPLGEGDLCLRSCRKEVVSLHFVPTSKPDAKFRPWTRDKTFVIWLEHSTEITLIHESSEDVLCMRPAILDNGHGDGHRKLDTETPSTKTNICLRIEYCEGYQEIVRGIKEACRSLEKFPWRVQQEKRDALIESRTPVHSRRQVQPMSSDDMGRFCFLWFFAVLILVYVVWTIIAYLELFFQQAADWVGHLLSPYKWISTEFGDMLATQPAT